MTVLAVIWLGASACSLHGATSTAATSSRTTSTGSPLAPASGGVDAEVAMPAGFPSDFPIYPRARLTAAAPFASTGQTAWGMEWQSTDPEQKVQAFYTKQLAQGDWAYTPGQGRTNAIVGTFTRKSDNQVRGTLEVNQDAGVITRILVSLVSPA
ncbi:MAG TPA: hypothetical protein VFL27_05865 [Candidatus Dormibacteraeota bacterium]|nr:hypothetical protein [Candidatus Dormibacteraeota bacterium]